MTIRMLPVILAGAVLTTLCTQSFADGEPQKPMDLTYDAGAIESAPTTHKNVCAIYVVATEDNRQNKQTIGATFGGPLLTGDASPWITDGLLHLKDYGYPVVRVDASTVPADGLLLKTSVTRAYTWQVGLKLFGMLALKAQFVDKNGGILQEKYYRAHGDKTNMWGASSEYVTTLNYGLNNLLRVMADDLVSLCNGTKVETYSYAGPDPKPTAK